jgi:hypothetical protein
MASNSYRSVFGFEDTAVSKHQFENPLHNQQQQQPPPVQPDDYQVLKNAVKNFLEGSASLNDLKSTYDRIQ